jgi:hypothetical protein
MAFRIDIGCCGDLGRVVRTWEIPVPGMLRVRVSSPWELTDTRAPERPALALTPRLVTVTRTPGSKLKLLRNLNPIAGTHSE